jgi:hypothetical protein
MNEITVGVSDTARLAELLAGLQRECLRYNVKLHGDEWKVEVTGH